MVHFNSEIGQKEKGEKGIIGKYVYSKRNESGQRLLRFCQEYNLKITVTFFKKKGKVRDGHG